MRILALSDIHGNLAAVRKLRHQESNDFDAVVVAGDIGSEAADQILEVLSTFDCPVLYIYGNWDGELEYGRSFGEQCIHLHMDMIEFCDIGIIGFSGCDTQWGQNPIAAKLLNAVDQEHRAMFDRHVSLSAEMEMHDGGGELSTMELWAIYLRKIRPKKAYDSYEQDWKRAWKEALALNKKALFDQINSSGVNPGRVVIVTHERLTRLDENISGIHCHLFGHAHGFKYNPYKGTHCVNVSVLDQLQVVYPKDDECRDADRSKVNAGTYAILEIDGSADFNVNCKELQFESDDYVIDDNPAFWLSAVHWLSGEEEFAEGLSPYGQAR